MSGIQGRVLSGGGSHGGGLPEGTPFSPALLASALAGHQQTDLSFGSLTNYHCCGIDLADLHELQRHIDEVHTTWPSAPSQQPPAAGAVGHDRADAMAGTEKPAFRAGSVHSRNPSAVHLRHHSSDASLLHHHQHPYHPAGAGAHAPHADSMAMDELPLTPELRSALAGFAPLPTPPTDAMVPESAHTPTPPGAAAHVRTPSPSLGLFAGSMTATYTPPYDDGRSGSAYTWTARTAATTHGYSHSVSDSALHAGLSVAAAGSRGRKPLGPPGPAAPSSSAAAAAAAAFSTTATGAPALARTAAGKTASKAGVKRRRFSDSFIPLSPPPPLMAAAAGSLGRTASPTLGGTTYASSAATTAAASRATAAAAAAAVAAAAAAAAAAAWWPAPTRTLSAAPYDGDGKVSEWLGLSPTTQRHAISRLASATAATTASVFPFAAAAGTNAMDVGGRPASTSSGRAQAAPYATVTSSRPAPPLSKTAARSRSFDQSVRQPQPPQQAKAERSPSLPSLSFGLPFHPASASASATTAATSAVGSIDGSSVSSPDGGGGNGGGGDDGSMPPEPLGGDLLEAWHADQHLALSTDRIGNLSLEGAADAVGERAGALERADDRPFRCMQPGCGKSYKNANGLKYHSFHGHADQSQAVSKPFRCPASGCGKAYKNPNGLKYHITHVHGTGSSGPPGDGQQAM